MMMETRKYPIGIQTFRRIIEEGYLYVDKTDMVWQLAHYAKFIFLNRPRRFGKSLLTTTLESYFKGEKELFEGLKIMEYEKEWEKYPVIHLDLSTAKGQPTVEALRDRLLFLLNDYTQLYGEDKGGITPGGVLHGLIRRAYEQTGSQVVVVIDEYDAPLLEVLHEDSMLKEMRNVMQEFYAPLKACERYIKFCFITGITKFSQLSIFSTLNNILNVTMDPVFSTICGITEKELVSVFREDIGMMAKVYGCDAEEMHAKLKFRYDGYHFSENSEDVYNPFSILNAFQLKKIGNYWFETGTPSYLITQLKRFKTDITALDDLELPDTAFNRPTESMTDALPLLYQSGYLTIKGFDLESMMYKLSMPNQEVRSGYAEGLLPAYSGLESYGVQTGFALKFWRALKKHDVDLAMREMQAYLAGIPYVEGFKRKLAEAATAEGFYEYTMYLIFSMLNVYVKTQVKCAGGRIDMVVQMPDTTYVFELKTNGTAQEALKQIDSKDYALSYKTDSRKVVKVGVKFDVETRVPEDWVIE